ncbi:MAG: tRNA lysidine(34) synthetase TilS [Planctomycetota bacterium]
MRRLLRPGDGTVIVGCSGGPDSTALLVALAAIARDLGVGLVAAHLDHGLRGEAARADRDFVLQLATRLGARFEEAKAPPLETRGRGIEAAAREVRYEFLLDAAERLGASVVAVAHTATDQAETVLLRILRGSGLRGLAAMPRSRRLARGARVRLVRPLLDLGRDQVEDYLAEKGVVARQDSMNADTRFARVRVRREILPRAVDLVNPAAESALVRVAESARAASRALEKDARRLLEKARQADSESWDRVRLARASDAVLDIAIARLLRRLTPEKLSRKHIRAVAALVRTGEGVVALPEGLGAWIEGEALRLGAGPPRLGALGSEAPRLAQGERLSVPGEVRWGDQLISARVVSPGSLSSDPKRACLDLACVKGTLVVRGRRAGDKFVPLGSSGATTLKRFFIDQKIPRAEREGVAVVVMQKPQEDLDQPVWVVGRRIDDRVKVTAATRDVLELRVSPVASPGEPE